MKVTAPSASVDSLLFSVDGCVLRGVPGPFLCFHKLYSPTAVCSHTLRLRLVDGRALEAWTRSHAVLRARLVLDVIVSGFPF